MSKLLPFKQWMSTSAAADYLSKMLDEQVVEQDIFYFSLADHLQLSVQLPYGTHVRRACWDEEARCIRYPDNPGIVHQIKGFYDLTNFGSRVGKPVVVFTPVADADVNSPYGIGIYVKDRDGELLEILTSPDDDEERVGSMAHQWKVSVGLNELDANDPDRAAVSTRLGKERKLFEVENKDIPNEIWWSMAIGLPQRTVYAVRTTELQRFIAEVTRPAADVKSSIQKPLTSTERNSLLVVIAGLAKMAKIDTRHHSAASTISRALEAELQIELSAPTIREKLDLIPDAIARRQK